MSDPQKPDDRAPRSGAGDAARTQPIPRIEREKRPRTVADALREARSAPTEPTSPAAQRRPGPARPAARGGDSTSSSSSSSSAGAAPAADEIKKPTSSSRGGSSTGSARSSSAAGSGAGAAKKSSSSRKSSTDGSSTRSSASAAASAASAGSAKKSSPSASGRESAPTAADYARTTGGGADTTSVMPAVKDEPRQSSTSSSATRSTAATSTAAAAPAPSGGGRQAKLRLTFIEPWSVTRLAFVVSVALMIVAVVAVTIFWVVLEITGIWGSLNDTVLNVLSDSEGSFDLTDYLGLGRLVGLTLVLSAVNVVLMTAVATIGAHLYNLAAQLLGGIEVTFTDD